MRPRGWEIPTPQRGECVRKAEVEIGLRLVSPQALRLGSVICNLRIANYKWPNLPRQRSLHVRGISGASGCFAEPRRDLPAHGERPNLLSGLRRRQTAYLKKG